MLSLLTYRMTGMRCYNYPVLAIEARMGGVSVRMRYACNGYRPLLSRAGLQAGVGSTDF
jgi:hypothetical protein